MDFSQEVILSKCWILRIKVTYQLLLYVKFLHTNNSNEYHEKGIIRYLRHKY